MEAILWNGNDRTQQLALAHRDPTGRGVTRNNVEAYRWLSLAIRGGATPREAHLPGAISIADRNSTLDRLAVLCSRMTSAEIVAAEQLVVSGMPIRYVAAWRVRITG